MMAASLRLSDDLRGQVAVVTGSSRGIGKGIAVTLGERGCTVYVTGRSAGGASTDQVSLVLVYLVEQSEFVLIRRLGRLHTGNVRKVCLTLDDAGGFAFV